MEATTAVATNVIGPAVAWRCASSARTTLKHQIRTKATSARTRRALNIPPHPTFLSSHQAVDHDTIVFNPPSSAASVYHTPFKFLPKSDPRRRANLVSLFESHFGGGRVAEASAPVDASLLGPRVGKPTAFDRPPVTKEEVEEMRQLRTEDPFTWTVKKLSDKFQIPPTFVTACCQAPKEKIEFERKKMELAARRWGAIKKRAMEEREKRRDMLYRGQL